MKRPSRLVRLAGPRRLIVVCALACAVAFGSTAILSPFDSSTARAIAVGHLPLALAVDGRTSHVFVANYGDGTISVLDAIRGTVIQTVALGQHPFAIAVDETSSRVFTLNTASAQTGLPFPSLVLGSVSMLDLHTGALLRTVTSGALPGALAMDERGGHLFVLNSGDSTLSMLDTRSGAQRTITVGGMPQALAIDATAGRVFVGTNDTQGHLVVLESHTGRRLRILTLGQSVGAVLSVPAAGRVVVAGDGVLSLVDARSGALLLTLRVAAVPLLAVRNSARVLVAGAQGLRLLDTRTGRWCGPWALAGWVLPPMLDAAAASDPASGHLLVPAQPAAGAAGVLAVLDDRRGRVLQTIPAGPSLGALAFDARTHQAIVLLPDGTATPRAWPLAGVLAWSQHWLPWIPLPRPPAATDTRGSVRMIALR